MGGINQMEVVVCVGGCRPDGMKRRFEGQRLGEKKNDVLQELK